MANGDLSVGLPRGGRRDDGCPGSAVEPPRTCAFRIYSSTSTGAEKDTSLILRVSHPLIPHTSYCQLFLLQLLSIKHAVFNSLFQNSR